jgi:hypothetical protein
MSGALDAFGGNGGLKARRACPRYLPRTQDR